MRSAKKGTARLVEGETRGNAKARVKKNSKRNVKD